MYMDFNRRHEVFPCPSLQLHHHLCLGVQKLNVTKCSPNAAPRLRINSCIYRKLKIMLTFTLTLETGACFSKVPKSHLWACLLRKADLLRCFQGNKKRTDCEVWWLKSSPFLRYRGNCDTWKCPVECRTWASGIKCWDTSCWMSKLGMNRDNYLHFWTYSCKWHGFLAIPFTD